MSFHERIRRKRIKQSVIDRDGFICCFCNKILTNETLTLEHIVPDSKRGTFNRTNLTISCSRCNNRRGNKPFFEFCKNFDFPKEKIEKYKRLYLNNLKIKVLNIAKEECLNSSFAIPNTLIYQACQILRINTIDFSYYESELGFNFRFHEKCERRKIKFYFEQLIKIIEDI